MIKFPDKDIDDQSDLSVSAVLNVDWCNENSKNGEWFRPNDYLTDTRFPVDLKSEATSKDRVVHGPNITLVAG